MSARPFLFGFELNMPFCIFTSVIFVLCLWVSGVSCYNDVPRRERKLRNGMAVKKDGRSYLLTESMKQCIGRGAEKIRTTKQQIMASDWPYTPFARKTQDFLLVDNVNLAPQFTWYTVHWVSRVLLPRDCFQVVYIFAFHSSLNTSTFCFLHVFPVTHLTDNTANDNLK